jgi:rubrerythrin
MRMEQIFRTSGRVETDDLDWGEAAAVGLTAGEVFALQYFADVEGQTVHYLRDLLRSRLARDPDVLGFLSIWSYEEYFHGQALARLLEACGHPLDASRVSEVRRAARPAERLEALGTVLCARIFPRSFPALYMAWGATQELTTLRGYEALQARTRNPALAELCRRIARQERRHYAWYFHSARLLLERSVAARRLTRFALERFWAPVGVAVKGAEDARRVLGILFPGSSFAAVAADVDARIGALPGLAGIGLLRSFPARASSRSPPEPAAPAMAVVLGGASQDVGAP